MDDDIGDTGMGPVRQTLSQLRLRDLLVEVQDRVEFTGSGLTNLWQRAERAGGEFTIESASATGGTRLRWSAPLLQ